MGVKKLFRKLFGIFLLFLASSPFIILCILEPFFLIAILGVLGGICLVPVVFFLIYVGFNYLFGD